MNDCLFCKIIKGEIPKEFTLTTDSLVAFPDINPSAEIHLLIVPKKHLTGMSDLTKEHGQLLTEIFEVANKLVSEYNLADKLYRIVVNGGKAQHITHLHFHLLGGEWTKKV